MTEIVTFVKVGGMNYPATSEAQERYLRDLARGYEDEEHRSVVMDAYRDLVDRAIKAYPEQAGFFQSVHAAWSARLDELPAVSGPRVDFLLREIARPDLDPDALARWPDVFPEAIEEIAMRVQP